MDLSLRNAKYFRMEKFKQMKIVDPDRHIKRIMSQMKNDLRLPNEPFHIECFDIKNFILVKCFQVCKDIIISLRSFAFLAFIFSIITFSIIIF